MTKPYWFIQEGIFPETEQENLHRLTLILEEQGCEVAVGKYVPFGAMDYSFFPENPDGPVILHGSIELLRDAQERAPRDWWPAGDWMDLNVLKCSHFYAPLAGEILNWQCGFYPLGMLSKIRGWLFDTFGRTDDSTSLGRLIFIRPDANDKSFTGGAVGEKMFLPWYKEVSHSLTPETMVLVSVYRPIHREWRLLMVDGEPVTGSLYKADDHHITEPGFPALVGDYARVIARIWSPAPAWVLDVAETDGGQLFVCELGAINCAGWYDADIRAAVTAINSAAIKGYAK